MGEVYRARDAKLGRDVAIKVLSEPLAADSDRIGRFRREAQLLASLNHAHIAHIYGIEDASGTPAIVMELVEGPTLADRIREGALSLDEALGIAKQIAAALGAAHEQGIIHRDLKPANIKLRPDGAVKLLDFGLAKAFDPAAPASGAATMSPTLSVHATLAGMILGTAAYMSPEQARGRAVDRRTDIWAFGCVLFEMLTGKRAFEGEEVSDTLASVLKSEPEWTALPAAVPTLIRTLLRRCLEKDRQKRIADISAALFVMEEPECLRPSVTPNVQRKPWLAVLPWAALFVTVAAVAAILVLDRHVATTPQVIRFIVEPPEGWIFTKDPSKTSAAATPGGLSVSPDGRRIAFLANTSSGRSRLWVKSLDSLTAQELPDTNGASTAFWSPDSQSLAFFADGKLKRIELAGGSPVTLCESPDWRGGSWSRSGVIVFASGSDFPLQQVSASGGVPKPVSTLQKEDAGHGRPQFLPDGRHFFYGTYGKPPRIYIGSLDSPDRQLLFDNVDSFGVAYAQGYVLFMRGSALMAQPFDPNRLVLSGEPAPVAQDVVRAGFNPPLAVFSSSENGLLAYQSTTIEQGSQLTWVDRSGKPIATVGDRASYGDLEMSADGTRAAVTIASASGTRDIWLVDLTRGGARTRLTSDLGNELSPVWSPDGRQIVFDSDRE